MNLYFWLNFAVIIGPLLLSFDKRVAFWRRWPALLLSMLVVSTFFIIWDIIVTDIGHWSFSEIYAGSLKILGLPIGEWLFFIAVPYATIFIYECVRAYTKDKKFSFSRYVFLAIGLIGILPLIFFINKGYTVLMGIVFLITLILIGLFGYEKFASKWTLVALILTYIPFLVFNGLFTYLPIVIYNPETIIGFRVISIPIEDFFYSFSIISLTMFFYFPFRERFRIKEEN